MKKTIPHGILPTNEHPFLVSDFSVTYTQNNDCCDEEREDGQNIEVHTEDGGGGAYFILSTKRWAFDNIEELIAILQDFKNRTNIIKDK